MDYDEALFISGMHDMGISERCWHKILFWKSSVGSDFKQKGDIKKLPPVKEELVQVFF